MTYLIIGNKKIDNPILAITPKEQIRGLQFETNANAMMVFPYTLSKPRKFWMKDTLIPLDIVFCNDNKVIKVVEAKAMSEELVGPDDPCDLVVELPAGYCIKNNIQAGSDVILVATGAIKQKIAKNK